MGSPLGRLRTSAWFSSEKVVPPGLSAVIALKMTMPATMALTTPGGRFVSRASCPESALASDQLTDRGRKEASHLQYKSTTAYDQ